MRDSCPGWMCLRTDGFICPDDVCDAEIGIYEGPLDTELQATFRHLETKPCMVVDADEASA